MRKFRLKDNIKVLSGKDKGKTGEVLRIYGDKVLVKGVNMVTEYKKKTDSQKGGIFKREAYIDMSNIMLICPHTNKPTRIGFKLLDNGKKVRFSKKANKEIVDSFEKTK